MLREHRSECGMDQRWLQVGHSLGRLPAALLPVAE
jgi:hypothetical protein